MWLALAGLALLVSAFVGALGSMPLIEADEGRYAEIPREMLATGEFVTPHLNGVVYLEKPPLYYWLNASSIAILGSTELAVRLWSFAFGVAGIGLVFALSRRMFGRTVALWSAAILGTSPLYFVLSAANIIDMTFSFLMSAALVAFWFAQDPARPDGRYWYGVSLALALALLAKGLIALVLPGAIIGVYVLLTRRWDIPRTVPWLTGGLLFLAVAAPWHVVAAVRNPDFLWFYFVHEHFLRFTTQVHERVQPIWLFVPILFIGALPWVGLVPQALRRALPARLSGFRFESPELCFLALWAGVVFAFFSLSQSKLIPYVLPCVMPMAALAASVAGTTDVRKPSWPESAGVAVAGLGLIALSGALCVVALGLVPSLNSEPKAAVAAALAVPMTCGGLALVQWRRGRRGRTLALFLAAALSFSTILLIAGAISSGQRTTKRIAETIERRAEAAAPVFSFRTYTQTLPFYLGRPIGVVDYGGDLRFGIERLSEQERSARFPSLDEFVRIWGSGESAYVVLKKQHAGALEQAGVTGKVLLEEGPYVLLGNG
jgi:4-amino-4-deoxy-L-arabinose transferase-like glycosyltransferase